MKCPHCQIGIHEGFSVTHVGLHPTLGPQPLGEEGGKGAFFWIQHMHCSECKRPILRLQRGTGVRPTTQHLWTTVAAGEPALIHPRAAVRPKAPPSVPADIAEDFNEACLVLADSAKASAALSRRCLQAVLRGQGYAQHDLAPAIQAAIDSGKLPSMLSENLDAVRNIGNFAAHPQKDTNSGEVLPVEPHEAEWNLEVLEGLFDFYYVQPLAAKAKRDALNAKLKAAGKPEMKG